MNLGNIQKERSLVVTPAEVAVNHKPVVALVFAVILADAGFWSSKKSRGRAGRAG